jgi:RNA polymerase sigma factor (sigma-70 family)
MNLNDLYKNAETGDKGAEDKLFRYLSERFEQFANRRIWNEENAKEIAQEALMLIAVEYKSISFEISFQAWAYKVLDNKILNYIKKKRQRGDKVVTVADMSEIGSAEIEVDSDLRAQLLDCLKKVGKVNRRHARIIDLHYLGYKTKEICERLKLSSNGFYIILHRARKMLEKCLETGEVK